MDRVLQNTPATITETWYQGDAVADPGTVTVTVTRDDGTQVSTGAATGTGATARAYQLTAADTAQLDRLTVTWASTAAGTLTTVVEVVGDFLFTIAEARKVKPLDNSIAGQQYSNADIAAMRTTVEDALEDACGVAFVPRYERSIVSGDWRTPIQLVPYLRAVRWAMVSGTALTVDEVAALEVSSGFVYGHWTRGHGNITVGYEHGMDRPPERVKRAALLLAKVWLVSGPVDDRATSFSSAETGATYSMVVPGRGGSITGVPEVDATIQQYRVPVLA